MICDHPNCTGRHSASLPKALMCPKAYARKLAGNLQWKGRNPGKVAAGNMEYYFSHRLKRLAYAEERNTIKRAERHAAGEVWAMRHSNKT
jgi:hypothetical protein